ncbi:MAG TPA: ABC transporter substrate-binding protein, partial [Chloroflexota bacterium]|nr:ABC transporter substrate-binding protein [Chloroflexota bacterium]
MLAKRFGVISALVLALAACGGAGAPSSSAPASSPANAVGGASSATAAKPAAPASAAGGAIKRRGTIRVALDSETANLDPMKSALAVDRQVMYNMFDTLVTLDKDLKLQPDLATSWDQPDPKTYIFHLRSGVKFQDGTDFNADAVKFSLDRYRNTATSPRASELADVAAVDVVDPMTVKVTMKNASAPFLATLVDRSGMITSPAATQAGADNFTRAPMKAGTG